GQGHRGLASRAVPPPCRAAVRQHDWQPSAECRLSPALRPVHLGYALGRAGAARAVSRGFRRAAGRQAAQPAPAVGAPGAARRDPRNARPLPCDLAGAGAAHQRGGRAAGPCEDRVVADSSAWPPRRARRGARGVFARRRNGANPAVKTRSMWQRWKRFAHRAAEIQSLVLLSVLYWVVVVPIGLFRRRERGGPPRWKTRPPSGAVSIDEARRQF